MLDSRLRPVKDVLLAVPARGVSRFLTANQLTLIGLGCAIAAAIAAARGLMIAGLAFWLVSRFVDGLDGAVARFRGQVDDFGGYSDIVSDTISYAAIPTGIAFGIGTKEIWIAAAVLLGTFYINSVSWTYLSAIFEKRGVGASETNEVTTVTMPSGLIEGSETVIFFSLFLLIPAIAGVGFLVMAGAVCIGIVQRFFQARTTLAFESDCESVREQVDDGSLSGTWRSEPIVEALDQRERWQNDC